MRKSRIVDQYEILEAQRRHCMAKEGVTEDHPWGDTVWKVKGKMFATGGTHCTIKSTPDKQSALIQHPAISVAPYVGRYGWVSIEVTDKETLALCLDLIDESYDLVAHKGKKPTR